MRKFILIIIFGFFLTGSQAQASTSTFGFKSIDNFRVKTYKAISVSRIQTQERIALLENLSKPSNKSIANKKVLDSTEKPIAYVKLFLLSIASFIFSSTIIFFVICLLILAYLLKLIYSRIRR